MSGALILVDTAVEVATRPRGTPTHAATTPVESAGTEFLLAFPRNQVAPDALELHVSAPLDAAASVAATVSGAALPAAITFSVAPGDVTVVSVPTSTMLSDPGVLGTPSANGLRLEADGEVNVHGVNRASMSTGAFLALPVASLGTRYRALGPKGSTITVVAATSTTTVTISPRATLRSRPGGTPFTVALNAGQLFSLRGSSTEDPTGTLITSDHPVTVLMSHDCSNHATSGCDHLLEQLPPVSAWGTDTVVVRTPRHDTGSAPGELIRVLADVNATEVYVDGVLETTLAAGTMFEAFRWPGMDATYPVLGGRITTSAAALVASFAITGTYEGVAGTGTGSSAMTVIAPVDQWPRQHVVSTLAPSYLGYRATVVVKSASTSDVAVGGVTLSAAGFEAIGSSGYSAVHLTLASGVTSVSANAPIAVVSWGVSASEGYALLAGRATVSASNDPGSGTATSTSSSSTSTSTSTSTTVVGSQVATIRNVPPPPRRPRVRVRLAERELHQVDMEVRQSDLVMSSIPGVAVSGPEIALAHPDWSVGAEAEVCIEPEPSLATAAVTEDRQRLIQWDPRDAEESWRDVTVVGRDSSGLICGRARGPGAFRVVHLGALRLGGADRIATARAVAAHLYPGRSDARRVSAWDVDALACEVVRSFLESHPLYLDPKVPGGDASECLDELAESVADDRRSARGLVVVSVSSPIDIALALPLARQRNIPLALIGDGWCPDAHRGLVPERLWVVGGVRSLANEAVTACFGAAPSRVRLAGEDREATAAAVRAEMGVTGQVGVAFRATVDVLLAGLVAAHDGEAVALISSSAPLQSGGWGAPTTLIGGLDVLPTAVELVSAR